MSTQIEQKEKTISNSKSIDPEGIGRKALLADKEKLLMNSKKPSTKDRFNNLTKGVKK